MRQSLHSVVLQVNLPRIAKRKRGKEKKCGLMCSRTMAAACELLVDTVFLKRKLGEVERLLIMSELRTFKILRLKSEVLEILVIFFFTSLFFKIRINPVKQQLAKH